MILEAIREVRREILDLRGDIDHLAIKRLEADTGLQMLTARLKGNQEMEPSERRSLTWQQNQCRLQILEIQRDVTSLKGELRGLLATEEELKMSSMPSALGAIMKRCRGASENASLPGSVRSFASEIADEINGVFLKNHSPSVA